MASKMVEILNVIETAEPVPKSPGFQRSRAYRCVVIGIKGQPKGTARTHNLLHRNRVIWFNIIYDYDGLVQKSPCRRICGVHLTIYPCAFARIELAHNNTQCYQVGDLAIST